MDTVRSASNTKIAKLDELLSSHLEANEEITVYRCKPQTAPGENFGSTLISLDVDITNKDTGEVRILHLVNKMIPESPFMRDMFNTKVTYFKEMDFYIKAVPAMLKLQQDHNVPEENWITNMVPKCYGARHGFGSEVDSDAAILLENLNSRGYNLRDKKIGLDLQHSLLVLEKLAYLHALPIALKKVRPDQFTRCITPAAKQFILNEDGKNKEEGGRRFADMCREIFKKLSIDPHIKEAAVCSILEGNSGQIPSGNEPFITISHEDLWINNILFRTDPRNENSPAALAFVDFQTIRLQTPVRDILFFVFTSVTPSVWKEHFDQLFEAYHESFCKCLRQVKCDANEYSKAAFLVEMTRIGDSSLFEIFNRSRIIEVRSEDVVGLEWFFDVDLGGQVYLDWLRDIVLEFNKRHWLKI